MCYPYSAIVFKHSFSLSSISALPHCISLHCWLLFRGVNLILQNERDSPRMKERCVWISLIPNPIIVTRWFFHSHESLCALHNFRTFLPHRCYLLHLLFLAISGIATAWSLTFDSKRHGNLLWINIDLNAPQSLVAPSAFTSTVVVYCPSP